MTFSEYVKSRMSENSATTENAPSEAIPEIISYNSFLKNFNNYNNRLNAEKKQLKSAFDTIKDNRKQRWSEEAQAKKAAEAEAKAEAERKLKETYSRVAEKYPELFSKFYENPVRIANSERALTDHNSISQGIFDYIYKIHPDISLNLYSGDSTQFYSKFKNLSRIHGDNVTQNNVVFFYDNTLLGIAKEGYVVTTDKICVRNLLKEATVIAIKDIKSISHDEKNIILNGSFLINTTVYNLTNPELVDIFNYCICNLLYLADANGTLEHVVDNKAVSNNIPTEQESTWKCSCGRENALKNNFCGGCGSRNPKLAVDWVCPNCNRTNPSDANFCGGCGTRKN